MAQAEREADDLERLLMALHATSGTNIGSFTADYAPQLRRIMSLESDLGLWFELLDPRPETQELISSRRDFGFALYAASCGMYRMAFASTRSFLEVSAFTIRMSASEYERRRWVHGRRDLTWAAVTSSDDGLYSASFLNEFCSEAREESEQVKGSMVSSYRRCSEYLHGAVAASSLLPERLLYDKDLSNEWVQVALASLIVVHHALFVRYFADLSETSRRRLDPCLETHLSHFKSIRQAVGLPVEEG
jgi:hypothetical protein